MGKPVEQRSIYPLKFAKGGEVLPRPEERAKERDLDRLLLEAIDRVEARRPSITGRRIDYVIMDDITEANPCKEVALSPVGVTAWDLAEIEKRAMYMEAYSAHPRTIEEFRKIYMCEFPPELPPGEYTAKGDWIMQPDGSMKFRPTEIKPVERHKHRHGLPDFVSVDIEGTSWAGEHKTSKDIRADIMAMYKAMMESGPAVKAWHGSMTGRWSGGRHAPFGGLFGPDPAAGMYEEIRQFKPRDTVVSQATGKMVLCPTCKGHGYKCTTCDQLGYVKS